MTEDRERAEFEKAAETFYDLFRAAPINANINGQIGRAAFFDRDAQRKQAVLMLAQVAEAARCEERTRTDAAVAAAEVVMEASRKKGLRLEALERALREISQLPLGDHRAQKIARTALERGDSHVQDQVPAIEGMYVSDRYDEQQLAFHVEGLRASKK